jgi:hypothetical protein
MELRSYPFEVMGGPGTVHLFAPDAWSAYRAAAAIAETRRLEQRYSRSRADSLLRASNARAATAGEAMLDDETGGSESWATLQKARRAASVAYGSVSTVRSHSSASRGLKREHDLRGHSCWPELHTHSASAK